MPAIHWFRRDLRRADNPALLDALVAGAGQTLALFVLDPALWERSGPVRRAYLVRSLGALDESLGGRLVVRRGDPVRVVPQLARELGCSSVHAAADFGPYGRQRDDRVAAAVAAAGCELRLTGSSYAVAPGRVVKADGGAYSVFTPFHRAWQAHGWRAPAPDPGADAGFLEPVGTEPLPATHDLDGTVLPTAGEHAARSAWERFRGEALEDYPQLRNRPDLDGTSHVSVHLRWGELHPRTLLADLGDSASHEAYRRQLAWREFYADVLFRHPGSARTDLRPIGVATDSGPEAADRLSAWEEGRTGYPFVDAGMRQLAAEGWLHNRVRMVVASFLVKDLHLPWQQGAAHFMRRLVDADLASNQHGWQWVAGTGTDAAPYYRVFNPVAQGLRFDPEGDYVRRYVPELRHLAGAAAHEPWTVPEGLARGYPERVVDHAAERAEALRRLAER